MTALLRNALCVIALFIVTPANAKDALSIDGNGNVTIPKNLSVGSITAPNLDQKLAEVLREVKSLASNLSKENTALRAQLTKLTQDESWFVYAKSLRKAFQKINNADARLHEFGYMSNSGFRRVHFSSWNKGMRLVSEPFMTGDGPNYTLGGSMWLFGEAQVKWEKKVDGKNINISGNASSVCSGQFSKYGLIGSNVYHMYYIYGPKGVTSNWIGECAENNALYARKRIFQ